MNEPTPEQVRQALKTLDIRHQKIVSGMLFVMITNPERVREREWITEQLTEVTLRASDLESTSIDEGIQSIQDFLQAHTNELLNASFLLFQRVALDFATRSTDAVTIEDAMQRGIEYLPSAGN